MARWRVRLEGDVFDLEDLPAMFTSPDLRVVVENDAYYLEASTFETLDQAGAVSAEAVRLLPMVNAAAHLQSGSFRDVTGGSQIVENTPSGTTTSIVVMAGSILGRAKVSAAAIVVDGVAPPPPPPGSSVPDRWLALASSDKDVADALTVLGNGPRDWVNLYKLVEIVNARGGIVAQGFASKGELSRFKGTANHQDVAGAGARHARLKESPVKRPMTLAEAEAFVERVVTDWLASLI